jgi:hypothetical protein
MFGWACKANVEELDLSVVAVRGMGLKELVPLLQH